MIDRPVRSQANLWGPLALFALAAAVYLPTVAYGFVNWDDPWYVLNNPLITSWRPANLWEIATRPAVRNYAPLTMFGYLLQHSLWGYWAGGYHLVNLLLHAANSVLVYLLVRQLVGRRAIAWMAAALFALHPVQIESVAWISSFKGLLSGAFILASLICWLRPRPTPRLHALGVLFHFLGLLSKALGITVPAIVVCYDVFVARRRLAEAIARQLVPAVLGILVLLVTMSAQTSELGGVRTHLGWSKARTAAVDTVILWKYVDLVVWPRDLCVLYDLPTADIGGKIALAAAAWLAVIGGAIAWRRRNPLFLVGLTAFFALLFPVLNFFPITTLMNDRYLYLPSIPLFVLMGAAIDWIAECTRGEADNLIRQPGEDRFEFDRPANWLPARILSRSTAAAAFTVLALGYFAAQQERLPVWRTDMALWNDAVAKSPGLTVVRFQWATALHNSRKTSQAVAALERALVDTHPDDADRERIRGAIDKWRQPPNRVQ